MHETASLVQRVADVDAGCLTPAAWTMARACLLDWLGCTVAGAEEPGPRRVRSALGSGWGAGGATVVGAGRTADAANAAMCNAHAAHVLEFDDVHIPSLTHISAPVFAAALAVAQERGSDALATTLAFVSGYEAMARIGRRVGVSMVDRYKVHPTGFLGYFGAAIAAARLLGLDAARTAAALGIAGGQAGGLVEVRGTMSKGFFAGHAAAGGVTSARLAAADFTSAADILGGEAGVFSAFDDIGPAATGDGLEILHNRFKVHASCALGHPMIDALLSLRDTATASFDQIRSIVVQMRPEAVSYLDRARPLDGLDAKFSAQYCAAVALVEGRVGPAQFADAVGLDERVGRLMALVQLTGDEHLPMDGARVTIDLDDGGSLTAAANPEQYPVVVDEQRLQTKFADLAMPVIGSARTQRAVELVAAWPDVDIGVLLATVDRRALDIHR